MLSAPSFYKNSALKFSWIALVFLALDQLTKWLAVTYLTFGEPLAVMPFFNLTLVYNEGAAFSFLADMGGWQRWFFVILALVITGALSVWLAKLPAKLNLEALGLQLIISGAIGNLIDRALFGKVTDFLDFYYQSWHYATFNIADVAISLGVVALILHEFVFKQKN